MVLSNEGYVPSKPNTARKRPAGPFAEKIEDYGGPCRHDDPARDPRRVLRLPGSPCLNTGCIYSTRQDHVLAIVAHVELRTGRGLRYAVCSTISRLRSSTLCEGFRRSQWNREWRNPSRTPARRQIDPSLPVRYSHPEVWMVDPAVVLQKIVVDLAPQTNYSARLKATTVRRAHRSGLSLIVLSSGEEWAGTRTGSSPGCIMSGFWMSLQAQSRSRSCLDVRPLTS